MDLIVNINIMSQDLERKAAELQRKEQELQRMQFGGNVVIFSLSHPKKILFTCSSIYMVCCDV